MSEFNKVAFSSARHDWRTPRPLFDALNAEFGFQLDAAATAENALCADFLTPEEDGLSRSFDGRRTFINPPYGPQIGRWVVKGYDEAQQGALVVLLIPARTETSWWHDYAMKAAEIRLIRGRLVFQSDLETNGHDAPFPSCVVVFKPGDHKPVVTAMERPTERAALAPTPEPAYAALLGEQKDITSHKWVMDDQARVLPGGRG